MQKIPTLFERDWAHNPGRVVPVLAEGCEWVIAGEGVATRKYDGSGCMIRDGVLFKRREVKPPPPKRGKPIVDVAEPPEGFEEVDRRQNKHGQTILTGWIPVGDGPADKWHREAFDELEQGSWPDGTYELVGPSVQGNREHAPAHLLVAHREALPYPDAPRTFEGLKVWLAERDIEGLVWHHPDGRMAKIKGRDFGLTRGPA